MTCAITRGNCVFNARKHCVCVTRLYATGIYARDDGHAMILVSWIETLIFITGVIIRMTPMK